MVLEYSLLLALCCFDYLTLTECGLIQILNGLHFIEEV